MPRGFVRLLNGIETQLVIFLQSKISVSVRYLLCMLD